MSRVRRVMSSLLCITVCLVLLLCCNAAQALTIPASQSELTNLADTVVLGTVISSNAHWNTEYNNIYTEVVVSVTDSLKGSTGQTITIIVPGGTVGEITQWVEDTATFMSGEIVGLFLEDLNSYEVFQMGLDSASQMAANGSVVRVIGGLQGKLSLTKDSLPSGSGVSAEKFKQNVQMALDGQIVPEEEEQPFQDGGLSNIYDITAISPSSASAGTNTLVTVTGSGFGATKAANDALTFFYMSDNGKSYFMSPQINFWSDTQIQAYVPICNKCDPTPGYFYSAASGPVSIVKGGNFGTPKDFGVTFGYSSKKWPGNSPDIRYKINDGGVAGRSAAVQAGLATWVNAGSKFKFTYDGTHSQTDTSRNGVNEIIWKSLPALVLGQASTWSSGTEMVECDFAFSTAVTWSYAATCPSGQYDLQSVATHESGHFLFLLDLYGNYPGFTQDTTKVMYGRFNSGMTRRTLHAHDIEGIRWIYGSIPQPPDVPQPVYRFFNTIAGGHFFTMDEAEKNTVIQNYAHFRPEGIGFYALPTQQTGTLPVYRFFNSIAGGHFFTMDETEKNTVIQSYKHFRPEGIGFYAFPTQQPGTLPVYRFFNTIAGGHFFTMDETEKYTVLQNYAHFRPEGLGFYAFDKQTPPPTCDPAMCLFLFHGTCVNGVCVQP